VVQNLVLNNNDYALSAASDALRQSQDQPKVVPTPGTAAAVLSNLRGQLEAGTLTSHGQGLHAEYSA
jgi:hypothetical protein